MQKLHAQDEAIDKNVFTEAVRIPAAQLMKNILLNLGEVSSQYRFHLPPLSSLGRRNKMMCLSGL